MTVILFRSLDTETTAMQDGEVIEVGWTDVWFDTVAKDVVVGVPKSKLYGFTGEMTPGALGTHHILPETLEGLPLCDEDERRALLEGVDFAVAHNASFERVFFSVDVLGEDPGKWVEGEKPAAPRWVDTLKCARRAWEEAPEFGLQSLRYWRGLRLDPELALPAHRAGPDSYVGAQLLAELLKTESVNDLVRWTKEPAHYTRCPIGKHKGQRWHEIPHGYLRWMTGGDNDVEFDLKFAARAEINRRAEEGAR